MQLVFPGPDLLSLLGLSDGSRHPGTSSPDRCVLGGREWVELNELHLGRGEKKLKQLLQRDELAVTSIEATDSICCSMLRFMTISQRLGDTSMS